jgi:hypothetical protein
MYALAYVFVTNMASPTIRATRTIPIMRRRIIKAGNRYFVYLPTELNDIWRYLHDNRIEVNLVIEIPER